MLKLQDKSIWKRLQDIKVSNSFLNRKNFSSTGTSPQDQQMGEHKIKIAAQQREISGEHTDSPQNGRKILANYISDNSEFVNKKEPRKFNAKRVKLPINKLANELNR